MARVHYEIPDDLHRRVKAAAALKGETLKDFLIAALEAAAKVDEKARSGRPPAEPRPVRSGGGRAAAVAAYKEHLAGSRPPAPGATQT